MSTTDTQGGIGQREVAYRVLAAEFDDATLTVSDSDDDRAPNYVILPTGARVNRVFVVGVLTEVEAVSDNVIRGRIVDPTGAFVVYAGQYQPDAKTFLEGVSVPSFVAVTGKARTYQPDESDRVFSSIRPETMTAVTATTRDRWTIQAAQHTIDRVETMTPVLARDDRGSQLQETLRAEGVDAGPAAGIPLAIDHYGVSASYLDALREVAIQAIEVVAGTRDDVSPLTIEPDARSHPAPATEPGEDAADTSAHPGAASGTPGQRQTPTDDEEPDDSIPAESGGAESSGTPPTETEPADSVSSPSSQTQPTDAVYEMDDDEREAIEEEYGTDFTTGNDVSEQPSARPSTESDHPAGPSEPDSTTSEPTADEPDAGGPDSPTGAEPATPTDADETAGDAESDLERDVIRVMRDLDTGDGVPRAELSAAVMDRYDVPESAVDDAIQAALMNGKCYEPADGSLKAI